MAFDPARLGADLEASAAAWEEILEGANVGGLAVFGRLEALARSWAALQREALAPLGLNYAELTTIGMLRTSQPKLRRSPSELRRLVGQSSAGMTRILDKLEQEGLVRRAPVAADGRRVDVVLTPRGIALAEESHRLLLAVAGERLAPLGKRRRDDTLRALDGLLALLAGPAPGRP